VRYVRIDWGDGSPVTTIAATTAGASHGYRRRGRFPIRVSATDRAGNAAAVTRRVRVGG